MDLLKLNRVPITFVSVVFVSLMTNKHSFVNEVSLINMYSYIDTCCLVPAAFIYLFINWGWWIGVSCHNLEAI